MEKFRQNEDRQAIGEIHANICTVLGNERLEQIDDDLAHHGFPGRDLVRIEQRRDGAAIRGVLGGIEMERRPPARCRHPGHDILVGRRERIGICERTHHIGVFGQNPKALEIGAVRDRASTPQVLEQGVSVIKTFNDVRIELMQIIDWGREGLGRGTWRCGHMAPRCARDARANRWRLNTAQILN